MSLFKLSSTFSPAGDQPRAIDRLSDGVMAGKQHQVLLGVTGSGKTFTMAHVVTRVEKPTLVIAPNKTLAAQLFSEFRTLFPENAVEYFVSYYDYYQPEAYIPTTDTYIQKDSSINEMIDKMRHSATRSVLSRRDVIVVASVSCIFGLGAPEDYLAMRVDIENDMEINRDHLLAELVAIHYERNDYDFHRGTFRVRGDRVEVFPAYEEETAVRIEFFGDQVDSIAEIDPLRGIVKKRLERVTLYPASHYVTQKRTRKRAIASIKEEVSGRVDFFRSENKLIEAQRIEERTFFDLEMMNELGYCHGIENYSRHLTGRTAGDAPPVLLDYFPDDYLLLIDESHIAVPQISGMYKGDRSRKKTLVEFGFRLPSALDNRPLKFSEFEEKVAQTIYVSATPAEFERQNSGSDLVEQIVRPTGLIDPVVRVRSAANQVDDLYQEILIREKRGERVLVTTLTKRMAEDLTEYYSDLGVKVRYLHADINTLERMDILRDLRIGKFDVLVGINLLREGLDIPEVSLVVILDADKEGFLRSSRSLIQTFGRAARNVEGEIIMYGDVMTKSMKQAIQETDRRRKIQENYNIRHDITPVSIQKEITSVFDGFYETEKEPAATLSETTADYGTDALENIDDRVKKLEKEMRKAVKALEFERAAEIRDKIKSLKQRVVFEY
jgi:excinuclease ABC subunit B